MHLIQLGLDESDDLAFIQVNQKWKSVPAWLWLEWEFKDGIQGIIDTWKGGLLKRYYPPHIINLIDLRLAIPDVEDEVFKNISIQAKTMHRFLTGAYRDVLNSTEIKALTLEKQLMMESPGLANSKDKYTWIADRMSNRHEWYRPNQVRDILERASQVMAAQYEEDQQKKLKQLVTILPHVWYETRKEQDSIAA